MLDVVVLTLSTILFPSYSSSPSSPSRHLPVPLSFSSPFHHLPISLSISSLSRHHTFSLIVHSLLVPRLQKVHGAPLGPEEVAAVKKKMGFDPEKSFFVPDEVQRFYAGIKERGIQAEAEWNQLFQQYTSNYPQLVG